MLTKKQARIDIKCVWLDYLATCGFESNSCNKWRKECQAIVEEAYDPGKHKIAEQIKTILDEKMDGEDLRSVDACIRIEELIRGLGVHPNHN